MKKNKLHELNAGEREMRLNAIEEYYLKLSEKDIPDFLRKSIEEIIYQIKNELINNMGY